MYLVRYHDVTISTSGVWRILKRLRLNRLPASQRYQRHSIRWKRYEKQRPGHQLQVDVKFIEPLGQKGLRRKTYYQFTAIDDCTRLRVLGAYPRCDQKTAIAFIDDVMAKLPFKIECIKQTTGQSSVRRFTGTCSTRRPRQDQTQDPPAERQGGEIPPDRLRRVLPAPPRPGHRRRQRLRREAARVGGLLQLPPPPRRPSRTNTLRTPTPENPRLTVIGLRQLHRS
jgi:hypothetical protein